MCYSGSGHGSSGWYVHTTALNMQECITVCLFACLFACLFISDVNRKILHEQNVEKTFIELLTSDVSCPPAPSEPP